MGWKLKNYNLAIQVCFERLIGNSFSLKVGEQTLLYVLDDVHIDWNKEELIFTFDLYKKNDDYGLYWKSKTGEKVLFTMSHFKEFIVEKHDLNHVRYIEILQEDIHEYIVSAVKERFKIHIN
ncbi:hypothetical protein [Mammaliicoccus sciuri]|uniref:hypothetical protein n=1 Tax=Mammaliicoccus sciuri TaxID=1296 RepID=UPI002B25C901|nr:hypothetical protein [Mammaliicoccus sciuri]WQK75166.1 hypothetical protein P3U33_05410 [Mammaliicoccus sciuri]